MVTVNINLGDATKLNLILGRQNENEVTEVVFDFSAWNTEFGSGTVGLSVQRPGDKQPYAVVPTVSGTDATWEISSLDTAYKGVGEIQVTYTVGTVVKKSVVYKFTVYESLGANGEYPSPGQTWQEEIEDELADVKQDFADYIYGTNHSFVGTPSNTNKFPMFLINGATYTATNNTGAAITLLLYKSDGTSKSISTQLVNGASKSFTVDSDDYVKIGGWFNAASTGALVVTGGIDSQEILTDSAEAVEIVSKISTQRTIKNEITDYTTTDDYIFTTIGDISSTGWAYYKMPCQDGDVFNIHTAAGWSGRAWLYLDSSDNVLSLDSYNTTTKVDDWSLTINNASAAYLVVNCDTRLTTVKIEQILPNSDIVNDDRIYIGEEKLINYLSQSEAQSNILYGKSLCCCGDSITYGADMDAEGIISAPTIDAYQWSAYTKKWTKWTSNEPAAYGYQIAARNNMKFYNGGVSGATVQASGGDITVPGFSDASGEYTLLPDNIDYLTLFYGWNDTAFGSLGTINDNTTASYYGAYNVVLPYLINKYPYTKIALIVPFGCDADHRQAIRLLANKWGLACFDMYKGGTPLYYGKEDSVGVDASVVTANRAKFQANGAHPNYKGHYQIGTMLEQFLRGI